MELTFESGTPAETEALGERLGALLAEGDLLDLRGDLGAGKTCFTRGIARGLGLTAGVRSPTFTICIVHRGEPTLFHLDAYRLEEPEELLIQGWDEMRARGVVVIEWGERVESLLPEDRLEVAIDHPEPARLGGPDPAGDRPTAGERDGDGERDGTPREITLRAFGPRSAELLEAVRGVDESDAGDPTPRGRVS